MEVVGCSSGRWKSGVSVAVCVIWNGYQRRGTANVVRVSKSVVSGVLSHVCRG